ncbi:fungal-specific transcription factor domain-containing protein [Aspergillus californicus]
MGKKQSTTSQEEVPNESPTATSKKVRRTRSRTACDWCHSHHAKCDLEFPCSRCLDKGTRCDFTRTRRKRGRKLNSQQTHSPVGIDSPPNSGSAGSEVQSTGSPIVPSVLTPESQQSLHSINDMTGLSSPSVDNPRLPQGLEWPVPELEAKLGVAEELLLSQETYFLKDVLETDLNGGLFPLELSTGADFTFDDASALPETASVPLNPPPTMRYPVLEPLMKFVEPKLSPDLACGLLDLYFTSDFPIHMHPVCHHIHCYVLRKDSFLSERNARHSSPALLASMLWVAAMDDRALSLPISPPHRKNICHFLNSITTQLLNPLTHTPSTEGDYASDRDILQSGIGSDSLRGWSHHGFATNDDQNVECSQGTVDDVITYMHIASIISASEQKAVSMRWWYAAFTLARELKLNKEMETTLDIGRRENQSSTLDCFPGYSVSHEQTMNCMCSQRDSAIRITEEQREERRRVWWLLYIMDRHLALCYNRPLMLLDSESKDLLLPLEEETWQAGDIHSNSPNFSGPQCLVSGHRNMRRVFPDFTCHDNSIFGFFLPLMTIMGQVADLNQMKNHPMLGEGHLAKDAWDVYHHEVLRQLGIYEASLDALLTRTTGHGLPSTDFTFAQTYWLTQTVASYASYYVHILHILLDGKWDLVSLIEDKDFWTSSPNFASTVSHALSAADAVKQILRFDPDVSFMPDFFGIQLLQGCFYFLLVVERLQAASGEAFLGACEVMIRATEACIVTLNTEYQRNFCQIMRSTVAQARGRPVNHHEIRRRHRAVLALYRWTGTGTGLAL